MTCRLLLLVSFLALTGCDGGGGDAVTTPEDSRSVGDDVALPGPDLAALDTTPPDDASPPEDLASPEDTATPPDGLTPEDTVQEELPTEETTAPMGPTAVVEIQEGEEVIPQTKLHLIGSQSVSPGLAIIKWQWSVEQPPGSASVFLPSAAAPDPTFEVNVAGTYVFSLDVWDELDEKSTQPAMMMVEVIPNEAIHIELLWHTPGDPDETDTGAGAGADLDLHFLHPTAMTLGGPDLDGDGEPDGWYEEPFDCFWFNAHPDWGVFEPMVDDDPGLDRDDTDGAGPENINLNIPEAVTYRVGVHAWSDHGFGPSFATVRVYMEGILVWESPATELANHDMWEVLDVVWTGDPADPYALDASGQKIMADYQHPFFFSE